MTTHEILEKLVSAPISEAGISAAHEALQQKKIELHRVDGWLTVPTKPEPSYIPLGMTLEDFKLLEDSLALWKPRIIKPMIEGEPPIAAICDGGDDKR